MCVNKQQENDEDEKKGEEVLGSMMRYRLMVMCVCVVSVMAGCQQGASSNRFESHAIAPTIELIPALPSIEPVDGSASPERLAAAGWCGVEWPPM